MVTKQSLPLWWHNLENLMSNPSLPRFDPDSFSKRRKKHDRLAYNCMKLCMPMFIICLGSFFLGFPDVFGYTSGIIAALCMLTIFGDDIYTDDIFPKIQRRKYEKAWQAYIEEVRRPYPSVYARRQRNIERRQYYRCR